VAITKGTPTATSGNLTTGFTLVINSGVQANDICVIGITNRDGTGNPTCTDNEGAGSWTRITTQSATTNGSISIWWKRASANTASKTITVGSCVGSASGVVMPFRGASLASSPFGTPVGEANASGNETQAEITTARAGSMVIHLVGCTSNDTLAPGNRTATTPSTITEDSEGVSSGGSDCSLSFASDIRSAAGATGAISWSQTDGTGASLAIELLPNWTPLTADAGSVAVTGTAATLKRGLKATADAGSLAITGTNATLFKGTPMTASPGSFAITGAAATLLATHTVTASSGSHSITGTDATPKRGLLVTASAGSVAVTGTNATLTYTRGSTYTLTADPGSVALTGTAATLKRGIPLTATGGAHAITGTAAALVATHKIAAGSGAESITGTAASLLATRLIAAGAGSIALTGTAAAVLIARRVAASAGSAAITGAAVTLTYDGSDAILTADAGSLAITGAAAALDYALREPPNHRKRRAGALQRTSGGMRQLRRVSRRTP
jgi:hypothetical protein